MATHGRGPAADAYNEAFRTAVFRTIKAGVEHHAWPESLLAASLEEAWALGARAGETLAHRLAAYLTGRSDSWTETEKLKRTAKYSRERTDYELTVVSHVPLGLRDYLVLTLCRLIAGHIDFLAVVQPGQVQGWKGLLGWLTRRVRWREVPTRVVHRTTLRRANYTRVVREVKADVVCPHLHAPSPRPHHEFLMRMAVAAEDPGAGGMRPRRARDEQRLVGLCRRAARAADLAECGELSTLMHLFCGKEREFLALMAEIKLLCERLS